MTPQTPDKLTIIASQSAAHKLRPSLVRHGERWTMTGCVTVGTDSVATYRLLGQHEFLRN